MRKDEVFKMVEFINGGHCTGERFELLLSYFADDNTKGDTITRQLLENYDEPAICYGYRSILIKNGKGEILSYCT